MRDIYLAHLDKTRPVVVLTRSALLGHLGTVTVASVTSTRRGAPTEVPLEPEQGLPKPCAVNLHNVFTLPRSDLGPFLATLPKNVMSQIDEALVLALGVGA